MSPQANILSKSQEIRETQRLTKDVGEVGSPLQKITLLQASELLMHLYAAQKNQGETKMHGSATD